jgi:hypothetical protein
VLSVIMKRAFLLLVFLLSAIPLNAHNVVWFENPEGAPSSTAPLRMDPANDEANDIRLPVPFPPFRTIRVVPDFEFFGPIPFEEPCTVFVNVDDPDSPLLSVEVSPSPALEVVITVYLNGIPPPGAVVTTEITGEWHATGEPADSGCTATEKHIFKVPVRISSSPPGMEITHDEKQGTVEIKTEQPVALQESTTVTGGWISTGVAQVFSKLADQQATFFRQIKEIGGGVLGTATDSSGKPQVNTTIGLPDGGPKAATDNNSGNYILKLLPFGDNLLQMVKTFLVTDPVTGELGTNLATFDIVIPIVKAYGTLNFKVEMESISIPFCNCTPWCSIGFATLDGTATPIYFSGGANPPKGGPASCGAVEVTVTRPDGSTFQLKAGKGRHQNAGPNVMPGTWKVTTKVCGQEKTCSISYP